MQTVAIVQARLGSSRLPAKVLLPLPSGRTVIEEVLTRCRQIVGVDRVVCAIPHGDDIIASFALRVPDVAVYRGPEDDVLARYYGAASLMRADFILRITADCPLLDPFVCTNVLALLLTEDADYASNVHPHREFPHGHDCEAFTMDALSRAHHEATDAYDREHVGPYMQRRMRVACLRNPNPASHIRITLDTLADYRRIWETAEQMTEAA